VAQQLGERALVAAHREDMLGGGIAGLYCQVDASEDASGEGQRLRHGGDGQGRAGRTGSGGDVRRGEAESGGGRLDFALLSGCLGRTATRLAAFEQRCYGLQTCRLLQKELNLQHWLKLIGS
jgi:hypothetical protein